MESTGTLTNSSGDNVGCLDLGHGEEARDKPMVALTTILLAALIAQVKKFIVK